MTRPNERGFTLVEVMIVVAILAILASLVAVSVKPRTTAVDIGHRFRALVDQASRDAVRAGAVRADVATALGTRARTQVIAAENAGTVSFYVQRLVEDAPPATTASWETVDAFSLPSWVRAAAYAQTVGTYTATAHVTDWSTFAINCFPDGSCDRKTVFFESSTGEAWTRRSRVAVLPAAAPHVISKWN